MAAGIVIDQLNTIGLPEEIVSNILFQSSTPTFLQLTRTSKEFFNCAKHNRELLLHHLRNIPGAKENLDDKNRDNSALFELLRQRATNNLYGINFTANVTEYLARYTKLNLGACCISGLDADYVRHALCFENSADIRQYTANCLVKEKISQHPRTRILKTVQWGRFLSVLCAYPDDEGDEQDFPDDEESDYSDSDSDSDLGAEVDVKVPEKAAFAPSVNALLESRIKRSRGSRAPGRRKPPSKGNGFKYQICHYDIYTLEDSATFVIDDQPGLVPRDFIVQTCLFCAILWDKDTGNGRPTDFAKIMVYVATETQMYYAPRYDEQTIWPKKSRVIRIPSNHSDDEEEPIEHCPEKIAFFRDGRRIKLYHAGGIVPYKVFSSFTVDDERSYASSNVVHYGGVDSIDFYVDTPFYGMHGKYYEDTAQHDYCYQTYLCLGTSKLNVGVYDGTAKEANVLCVLRSQTRMDPEDCDHKVNLQRMAHLSAQSSSIVARLWGWEEMNTNLTGKESVAVSSGGTRIAIAMWDKVLIYAINPKLLCEETVVDSSDDEAEKSKKKKRKAKKTWEYPATEYYHRVKDVNLLDMNVAQLKPVVIDLQGAVAHRMHWSPAKGKITDTAPTIPEEPISEAHNEDIVIQGEDSSSIGSSSDTGSDNVILEPELDSLQPQTSTVEVTDIPAPILDEAGDLPTLSVTTTLNADVEQLALSTAVATPLPCASNEISSPVSQEPNAAKPETLVSGDEIPSATSPSIPIHETLHTTMSSLTLTESNTNVMNSLTSNALASTAAASQAPKLSARKKEKSAEMNNENVPPTTFSKDKIVSGYAVVEQPKQKNGTLTSTPSSPIMSKVCHKPKQTVAEALATNNIPPLPPASLMETDAKPVPATETSENSQDESSSKHNVGTTADAAPSLPNIEQGVAIEPADLSKSAIPEILAHVEPAANEKLEEADKEKEAQPKRRKRITEDELIILTDRGIQIWNLGAKAKGIRPRPRGLPMEEGLAGRIPLLKQSQIGSKKPEKDVQVGE